MRMTRSHDRKRSPQSVGNENAVSLTDLTAEATIVHLLEQAIAALNQELPSLEYGGVHERAVAHRLAVHMEQRFQGWNVDCEYNRHGTLQKLLVGIKDCVKQKKTNLIYPDIIVHHRRQSGRPSNLLVVEMKVHDGEDACDRKKLELMTDKKGAFRYQLGLFINVNEGDFKCTWFRDGKRLPSAPTNAVRPSGTL